MNEALVAGTLNAAASIGKSEMYGSLEVGKVGDLLVLDAPQWEHLLYRIADEPIKHVVKRGEVIELWSVCWEERNGTGERERGKERKKMGRGEGRNGLNLLQLGNYQVLRGSIVKLPLCFPFLMKCSPGSYFASISCSTLILSLLFRSLPGLFHNFATL